RARGKIGQPLVDLVPDVARHALDDERRQEVGGLTGGRDDQGAAANTVGGVGPTGREEKEWTGSGEPLDPERRAHACLGTKREGKGSRDEGVTLEGRWSDESDGRTVGRSGD